MTSLGVIGDFEALGTALKTSWKARFSNIEADDITLEHVAQICSDDFGLPYAGLAEKVFGVLSVLIPMAKAMPDGMFAPGFRPGPPSTEADWSHGVPQAQPVTNISGAIGGDDDHS